MVACAVGVTVLAASVVCVVYLKRGAPAVLKRMPNVRRVLHASLALSMFCLVLRAIPSEAIGTLLGKGNEQPAWVVLLYLDQLDGELCT